jgi:lipopolysaccharide/colanic/teichoic acid biosynthesis glycosyltransferase
MEMNGATREVPGATRLSGSLDVDFSVIEEPTAVAAVSARPDAPLEASDVDIRWRGLYERVVKPVIDGFIALICLILLLPVLATVALVVRIALGPGIMYRQVRVGRDGRRFTIYKFRTMLPDRRDPARQGAPWFGEERRVSHKREDDPRHTPTGRFLRKWSLDELPQLFNVLKGDMSLVGPRPELASVVERYEPWQHRRHDVKPGLTGLWQVSARGSVEMHHATPIDLEYVDHLSLLTDLKIVARTIPVLLARHNGS